MKNSFLARGAATLAVAATLATGLASTASAQVHGRTDAEQGPGSGSSYSTASCGFYFSGWDTNEKAYYNHCSSYDGRIKVRFSYWPFASYKEIRVMGGVTNLTDHWDLQGRGKVTYACAVGYC
ncbi:DUF6355 family natural product biosynthesis protein [Lentzea sp. NPDC092896]|uniref:DUF6355 family natural product biosynthesis protein n=1 Tax=Lentzea sp. NPDC092896 TaxID=3364127 RepID=UPI00381BF715